MSGDGPYRECARCSRYRSHRARGLCSACYQSVHGVGGLDAYEGGEPEWRGYCECPTPNHNASDVCRTCHAPDLRAPRIEATILRALQSFNPWSAPWVFQ